MRKALIFVMVMAVCCSLALAVAADNFVESVTAKPAPEVSGVSGSSDASGASGDPVIVIKNEDSKVVASTAVVNVEVTPVSAVVQEETEDGTDATQPTTAISEEEAQTLKQIYEELSAPDADIVTSIGLEDVVKEQDIQVENLVVKDLFNITIHDESAMAYLEEEGHTVDITFKADIQEGQKVIVAVFHNGEWILAKEVVILEDGSIVATLECVGTVAIIVA